MKDSIIIGLLHNTAILLAFAMIYENIWIKDNKAKSNKVKIITGIILGFIGILLMYSPWTWIPGIVFDTRSVLIAITGLFFGTIPTLIVIIFTATARLIMGGDGLWMGLAVIFSSGAIGLLWRKYRPNWYKNNKILELIGLGLLVHFTMLSCTVFLPGEQSFQTFKKILLPVLFIYTPVTVLLGLLMLRQKSNFDNRLVQFELKESERRFSQILESGNFVSIMLDKNANIQYCNNYFLEISGYSFAELNNKNWFELFISPELKPTIEKLFYKGINSKRMLKSYENQIITKYGSVVYIRWHNISLHSDSDENLGMASIGINITESKKYAQQLEEKNREIENQNHDYRILNKELLIAKKRAEESERLKSAFLANMSHEIRTPMNGIIGFTNLLKEPNLSGEDRQEFISIIEKSGERMLNIINDLINISKIESGQMEIFIDRTNINMQLEYIYNFFKLEAKRKGIELICNLSLNNDETNIYTDKEKLYAVLTNLVKNAIKFTDSGRIEMGYDLINDTKSSDFLKDEKTNFTESKELSIRFFVKDTGCGISKYQKRIIFERFRQGSDTHSKNYEGAGLGLSISKAFVEMLGGELWVESIVDEGSTFYFTLPYKIDTQIKKEIEKPLILESNTIENNKRLKILIAEDDETSYRFLSLALRKFSKDIFHAESGVDAIEIMTQHPDINLILMDVQLPEMDGYEATNRIRQFNKEVIIIAQTAFALSGEKEKALEAGCTDYISKPVSINRLTEMIKKHIK